MRGLKAPPRKIVAPAFFTAWIDRKSYRTRQLRMTAAAHFMFHRYLRFNAPVRISAPAR